MAYIHRDFPTIKALYYQSIFEVLRLNLYEDNIESLSQVKWSKDTTIQIRDDMWEMRDELENLGIPTPSKKTAEPIRYISSILTSIGLSQKSHQKRYGKRRIRDYSLKRESLERMLFLSESQYQRLIRGDSDAR